MKIGLSQAESMPIMMSGVPSMTAKAVAFVTRPAANRQGLELLVWSHPMAGVQLPAGSLFDGEGARTGASREAWEESGLRDDQDLDLVDAVGEWEEPSTGLIRYAFHYRCLRETPAEWWVITPDGNGLSWRCWWTRLDGTEPLHPAQRRWLDRVRHRLHDDEARAIRPAPSLPAPYNRPDASHIFVAPPHGGRWLVGTWVPNGPSSLERVTCAHAVCVDEAGQAVIIAEEELDQQGETFHAWAPPGGGLGAGESVEAALEREVKEEACAGVIESEILGFARVGVLNDVGELVGEEWWARAWSRVRIGLWEPRFETVARRLVPVADLVSELPYWRHPLNERWFVAALAREHAASFERR